MIHFIVGENLKFLRLDANMTRADLGVKADKLDASYIGRLERGQKNATIGTLRRIVRALHVDLCELFRERESDHPFALLEYFLRNNLPDYDPSLSATDALERIGHVMLDKLTLDEIEQNIHEARHVTFLPKTESTAHGVTYGLTWEYKYWYGISPGYKNDICCNLDELNAFRELLMEKQPAECQIEGIIEDFIHR